MRLGQMKEAFLILLAYVLTDLIAAIYHLVTDRGFNIPAQVRFFKKHHERPLTMTFDLQPMLAGIPLIVAGLFVWPWFLIPLGLFLSFAQVPHYYAHFPAPAPVRWLQSTRLILSPAAHASHHQGRFDRDFCVVSGWCNPAVNWLAKWLPEKDI